MRNAFVVILSILILVLSLSSCRQNKIDGIVINTTLLENQNHLNYQRLKQLIHHTLQKDATALKALVNFECGGSAGCYDLGFIVTQIIYSIGQVEFSKMVTKLNSYEVGSLEHLIRAGLEYGDNDNDNKMDNKKLEIEFPELLNQLKTK